MPFCMGMPTRIPPPLLPGRRPWNTSSMPTSSSSPWTTSGAGIAITISSPNCCGSGCSRSATSPAGADGTGVAELHGRASQWYEDHGLDIEAFQHAGAANDVDRAERLIDEKGLLLHFRGVVAVLDWLESLPTTVLDARPSLRVRSAMLSLTTGQATGVEEKLQAAEDALQDAEPDDRTRDLIGQIAAARATLAGARNEPEAIDHAGAPCPGVPASRQPVFSLPGAMDAGMAYLAPGRPCRSRSGLYRSPVTRPGVREHRRHQPGYDLPGRDPGAGSPASSGGRNLSARPATGR